jgi:adenylate kinase family enzyme
VPAAAYEALLIGGRSGVGKTTVGWEISAQLQVLRIAHCLIEATTWTRRSPLRPTTLLARG